MYEITRYRFQNDNLASTRKDVTVIVANKYPEYFERYLQNLMTVDPGVNINLIRVDGSDPSFRFSSAMNRGLEQAQDDWVLFMNDDTRPVSPKWLSTLVNDLEEQKLSLIGPLEVFTELQLETWAFPIGAIRNIIPILPVYRNNKRGQRCMSAFCLLGRRADLQKIGGFDEFMEWNYEDYDLSLRMEAFGKHGVDLGAAVLHSNHASWTGRPDLSESEGKALSEKHYRSGMAFLNKWGESIRDELPGLTFWDTLSIAPVP